jgi:hypothetical protein
MTATPTGAEKVTIAKPLPILKAYGMRIILPIHADIKRVEVETTTLLGVAFGFLNLANHSIIHVFWYSFRIGEKNSRHAFRRMPAVNLSFYVWEKSHVGANLQHQCNAYWTQSQHVYLPIFPAQRHLPYQNSKPAKHQSGDIRACYTG